MNVLGCWYSNCGIHEKIIASSLHSIRKAVDSSIQCKPKIITCNWSKLKDNPFEEHITYFKMGVHLGIVLQVLRILYESQKHKDKYDVVCFLEHDVLYPHDYFDRVVKCFEDNEDKNVVSNMDYIGMNQTGWLDVVCRQEPLHQMSFKFDLALKHFEAMVKDSVMNGQVILENSIDKRICRIPFYGIKPSCHINHSKHFTSHFDCYAKRSDGKLFDSYWGDFKKYYPPEEKSMQKI